MLPLCDTRPLVSCIMPTANRRAFVPIAVSYFLRQDYPHKELVIVDDGTDSVEDLLPCDERIRYLHLGRRATVGAKRNLACEIARGEIIAHWDDDDWQAPHRLRYQVEALLNEGTDLCGINRLLFYDLCTGRAWQYVYPAEERLWLSGSTLCYTRAFWAGNPFVEIDVGEDAYFVWNGRPERITVLPDSTFHIGLIHGRNVSPKQTGGCYWQPYPVEQIHRLMGADWLIYHPDSSGQTLVLSLVDRPLLPPERTVSMIAVARETDLSLPEFAAFCYRQSLPRMRRWELPFALFQARLGNTMSVLDCTINPVNFEERLARLYPHTLYRHWNPVQNGQFTLPFGVPDEAFDRVFCINTLEHLLRSQRQELIAAVARKLKPGGWLILTSDFYFDAFWEDPHFLEAGVMRPDREEIFNGWNRVTPQEWSELCFVNDLHPMAETLEDPDEGDVTLFRNQEPYPHACVGGVFFKSCLTDSPQSRRVVLALLTWNTRDVSLDSMRAYIQEARMLQRLGHAPLLCICDNGSSDGTAEALRALESDIDVPYRLILNQENRGNAIARNQIIDAMLEYDADYLLFMDGDIEIVPFSSFAMLRYMENSGSRLGCLGADSQWQTPHRGETAPYLYSIDPNHVETCNLVAWTQYGMFRRAVFEDGVRFDDRGPFAGPGWGFEDNDLAFQMDLKGYLNQRFLGMVYLHRAARSSVHIMLAQGIDAQTLYAQRKQYLIDKWQADPVIAIGPLEYIRQVNMNL